MGLLPKTTIEALKGVVNSSCSDPENGLPGAAVAVVGKDGKLMFLHTAGQEGHGRSEPLGPDSVFWIASCTKLITGIACMQLVEQGRLSLDSVNEIEQICPELKDVKVLKENGILVDKERGITLRMLLSHTAGFGYSFMNPKLREYSRPIGYNEFSGYLRDFQQPLVNQPGEAWEYGINIDWVGILIERVTGKPLNQYFQLHIFDPLGLDQISMIPTEKMKNKLAYMHQRDPTGRIHSRDHLLRLPLIMDDESDMKSFFNSGGAGCFSTPQDYCQILAVLLNDGTSPSTGSQLLKKSTVDEMFRNQLENLPPLAEKVIPNAKADLTNSSTGLHPTVAGDRQGWGLTFMLSGGSTGRSIRTAQWSGLPNLFWWCDRENGVAGMICTQILPFGDAKVFQLYQDVEAGVYRGLAGSV
ncbi:hypothetical protein PENARI_c014G10445 [Penicillium arizonense]|uniref:Beta-lactamase-related domain-containing protein n=1 Tax=Penicillium arizonense TaxID=1835702 RepID=A0A1F5LDP5_PENAI|nr:hypothetical protein PENARI_c014G10445 [Penicillium arizonense]OGE51217.1 hypothetical protein PENARI_c014G10445 [Penicillium arizonense]